MEVGSIACFTPKSCNNLILQVIQTKRQEIITPKESPYIPTTKKCPIIHNKKDGCGIVKFPYRNQWKKIISKSIVSRVNYVVEQCHVHVEKNAFLLRRKKQGYQLKIPKNYGNDNLQEKNISRSLPSNLRKDDESIYRRSFLGHEILDLEKKKEIIHSEKDLTINEDKVENSKTSQEDESCVRSFLEDVSNSETCPVTKGDAEIGTSSVSGVNANEVCARSLFEESLVESKACKEPEAQELCPRLFWEEISKNHIGIENILSHEEYKDSFDAICNKTFLDEHIEKDDDQAEDEIHENELKVLMEQDILRVITTDGNDVCFDEASFLALMSYKPEPMNDIVSEQSVSMHALFDIQDEVVNKTNNVILFQNITRQPSIDLPYYNSIQPTYFLRIMQDNHIAPLFFFTIGILSGILFFLIILQKNGKYITEEIPCCAESQTSSTYSNTQQQPPSQVLQEQIQIIAPPGPLGIVLQPSPNGPTIFCINYKSPMVGLLYPGDIIVAVEMEDVRDWRINVLMLWITRNSRRPRLLTILR